MIDLPREALAARTVTSEIVAASSDPENCARGLRKVVKLQLAKHRAKSGAGASRPTNLDMLRQYLRPPLAAVTDRSPPTCPIPAALTPDIALPLP